MTRHWNEGSAVQSVTFERATHTLRVQFASGETYDFADVPERLFEELAHSPAPDAFFHENIAEEFSATRVGDVDLAEMAHERREDALLGAPLAESVSIETVDERDAALGSAGTRESAAPRCGPPRSTASTALPIARARRAARRPRARPRAGAIWEVA